MKNPKEAVDACLPDSPADCYNGQDVIDVALWAQWAHEQLRPRKVSEEKQPEGKPYFEWCDINKLWLCSESNAASGYWLPMPPPPPEDDGFEAWVENHPEMDPPKLWKTRLQECWQAAQAAMRKDKE